MKRLIAVMLMIALCLSLSGCFIGDIMNHYFYGYLIYGPMSQPGTTWRSEDGKIQFSVVRIETESPSEDYVVDASGTMETVDGCIDIQFEFVKNQIIIGSKIDPTLALEIGGADFTRDDQFTVTFNKMTTYLEEGAVITFYRVDE